MAVETLGGRLLVGWTVRRFEVGPGDDVFIANSPDGSRGTVAVARSGTGPYLLWVEGEFVPVEIPEVAKTLAPGETVKL